MEILTEAQIKILTNAAKEPEKDVREFLTHIRNPQFKTKVLENLAKAGMVYETTDTWLLTEQAKINFGTGWTAEQMAKHLEFEKELNSEEFETAEEKTEKQPSKLKSITQYGGIKGRLCEVLMSENGLSLKEFSEEYNWLEKTVRGTMSTIKKETGMKITRIGKDEKTIYKIENI